MNSSSSVSPVAATQNDRAAILVMAALLMSALILISGFALDVGHWYNSSSQTQRAADISALAAVEELVRVEAATSNRGAAELAAVAMAEQVAQENGYDPSNVTVAIAVDALGNDQVTVTVVEPDLDMYFAGVVIDQVDISQAATASMNDCAATCGDTVLLTSGLDGMTNAGTGGDGWRPTLTSDNLVFNLFHHQDASKKPLMCIDKNLSPPSACVVNGNSAFYPLQPFSGMVTNYTPKLAAIGSKVYFVVQENNKVGLGCWDGSTHSTCGLVPLENYDYNNKKEQYTRLDGPEVIGNQLFMWGDNGRVYCVSGTLQTCTGYPKDSALKGVHDMTVVGGSIANGVESDSGMQFDMEPSISGDRIFLSLTPAPSDTWLTCWDTSTHATCSGFASASTAAGRPFLFLKYSTSNTLNGICARGGDHGGGSGHECFTLAGASTGTIPNMFDFSKDGDKASQQSATGTTSFGNLRTFFPFKNIDGAKCWDWTINSVCVGVNTNWHTEDTADYAYIYDGVRCMYGLGHKEKVWTFDIDTGLFPCPPGGSGTDTIYPCSCADGTTDRWTSLVLTPDTNLSAFDKFEVTVTDPAGNLYQTIDMTTVTFYEMDLRPLNLLSPPPAYMTIVIDAELKDGYVWEDATLTGSNNVGIIQLPGILPVLID
jgi:hypothetical protein